MRVMDRTLTDKLDCGFLDTFFSFPAVELNLNLCLF